MRLVFDSDSWRKTGDIGDNSIFWKKATLIKVYHESGETVCDVMFEDGRVSSGHFLSATKEIVPEEPKKPMTIDELLASPEVVERKKAAEAKTNGIAARNKKILKDFEKGLTYRDIAEKHNLHYSTVYNIIRKDREGVVD